MRPPTGSGRRVEAHRRRSCLARGFRGGVSPSLLVSGGYHFGVGFRSELGVARHLSILTLCALFFLSALQLASIAASRAEVATTAPLVPTTGSHPRHAGRPCARRPAAGHDPGRGCVATADDGEAPGCDASSEPEIRAQAIINAPTRGLGTGHLTAGGGGVRPRRGSGSLDPLQRHIRGRDGNFVRVCVCLPRRREREKKKRGARFGTNDGGGTG